MQPTAKDSANCSAAPEAQPPRLGAEPPAQSAHKSIVAVDGDVQLVANLLAAVREEHLAWCDSQKLPVRLCGARWSVYYAINRLAFRKRAVGRGELVCSAKPELLRAHAGYRLGTIKAALTRLIEDGLVERIGLKRRGKRVRCYRLVWRPQRASGERAGLLQSTEPVARDSESLLEQTGPVARDSAGLLESTQPVARDSESLLQWTEPVARDRESLLEQTTRAPSGDSGRAVVTTSSSTAAAKAARTESDALTPAQQEVFAFLAAKGSRRDVAMPPAMAMRNAREFPDVDVGRWRRCWTAVVTGLAIPWIKEGQRIERPHGTLYTLLKYGFDPSLPPWGHAATLIKDPKFRREACRRLSEAIQAGEALDDAWARFIERNKRGTAPAGGDEIEIRADEAALAGGRARLAEPELERLAAEALAAQVDDYLRQIWLRRGWKESVMWQRQMGRMLRNGWGKDPGK